MHRRNVLKGGLGLAATVLTPRTWAFRDSTKRRLPIPALVESHEGRPIELVMKAGQHEMLPGIRTETAGFNGPCLHRRGRRDMPEMGHRSMGINGRAMDVSVINERVRRGQWERWHIDSDEGSHPFHIHGCSFLVESMDGKTVSDDNAGWKDTVWVDDDAELIVRFDHEATEAFPYMYHCHILEHEDRGMMGQFTVSS